MSLLDKVFVAGWIIRKHIGWKHIDPSHADCRNHFYAELLRRT